MTRKMTLTFMLMLSLLLSLVSFPPRARAQQPQRFRAVSGVVTLAPNQVLRISITSFGEDEEYVRLRRTEYGPGTCSAGVCKHPMVAQSTSGAILISPGESVSMDIHSTSFGVQGTVLSNRRDARVVFIVFDVSTQRIVAIWDQPLEF